MKLDRRSGMLLHITSLPSRFGIGDLGPEARNFSDFLNSAGQSLWQVLPLNPTRSGSGHSPYSSVSAFAGNTLLVSPELLVEEGILHAGEVSRDPFPDGSADFRAAAAYREPLLSRAARRLKESSRLYERFREFRESQASWLDDFCLFEGLHARFEKPWFEWPPAVRDREADALGEARLGLADDIERISSAQFFFFSQWGRLRSLCRERGILLIGDIPLYVSHDSADVWSHPHLFRLDRQGKPISLSGVPPDYFSPTGQLWSNPIYDWDAHEKEGFRWWTRRAAHNLDLFDGVRLDHFRGLESFWEVDVGSETAESGLWSPGPGAGLLSALRERLGGLPLIAEDLGDITDDVYALRDRFALPGMRVFQFGFGDGEGSHIHLPHRYPERCVAYTGTHDNDTLYGWLSAEPETRSRVMRYLKRKFSSQIHWHIIREIMVSPAAWTVFPVQDVLGLDGEARMNRPATVRGNWRWRLKPGELQRSHAARFLELTALYGRLPSSP